jgi:hypothetical protein
MVSDYVLQHMLMQGEHIGKMDLLDGDGSIKWE